MADTTYYGIPLPTVGADFDTWGGKDITLHETWDGALASPTNTIKGRNNSGTGPHENLTPAEVSTMLPVMVGDAGSGGTKGLVPAPPSGSAANRRFLSADGTWKQTQGVYAWARVNGSTGALISGNNVTSSARDSLGSYRIVMTTAAPNANYGVNATVRNTNFMFATEDEGFARTTTQVRVRTMEVLVTPAASIKDCEEITISVYA